MDVSGDVADLMVKESIQLTEESIKLLAAGSRNLAAFLLALAKDSKKLVGKTGMKRLLREGKELQVFPVKESDLAEFRAYAKKNILYAVVKDSRRTDGMVDMITNVDFISQVNSFLARRGYNAPTKDQETETPKKAVPRAPHENSSPERGSGSTAPTTRTTTSKKPSAKAGETPTVKVSEIPTVKGRLAALRAASDGMKQGKTPQHTRTTPPKTR